MKESLAIFASLLAIFGNVSYLKDTFTNKVKPHPYTWLVWSIVSLVTFFGQLQKGAGIGALPTGVAEAFTIIIFIYSLKYIFKDGFGYIRKIDTYFLVAALTGLIPWFITKDPTISVITVVTIDLIAFIPTMRKTWRHPETETPILYGMNVARHFLALLSLMSYNIATTLHSIIMIFVNSVMVFLISRKYKK